MDIRVSRIAFFLISFAISACGGGSGGSSTNQQSSGWETTNAATAPDLIFTNEFSAPQRLNIATLGWEGGLSVSRDGIHLYATYMPADLLSFTQNSDSVENLQYYDRGPHYDMDFTTNPTGASYP